MKIKQTKTVKMEFGYHEERVSIIGMPKDLLIDLLESRGNLTCDSRCLVCGLSDAVGDLSVGEELEL